MTIFNSKNEAYIKIKELIKNQNSTDEFSYGVQETDEIGKFKIVICDKYFNFIKNY
ncbi:MAG: hypothetical protein ACFFDN_02080 [Candidatus Hodarchaeota archaeon]